MNTFGSDELKIGEPCLDVSTFQWPKQRIEVWPAPDLADVYWTTETLFSAEHHHVGTVPVLQGQGQLVVNLWSTCGQLPSLLNALQK